MDYSKWMKNIDDSTPLTLISIPGTHDSCSKNIALKYFSKCHDKSIKEQLNSGVRFLDIRLAAGKTGIKTVHSILSCKKNPLSIKTLMFKDVFEACKEFLKKNSSEAIIMCIKMDWGKNTYHLYKQLFDNFIEPYKALWFCENRLPTLKECRGKIILLRRDDLPNYFMHKNSGLNIASAFYGEQDDASAVIKEYDNFKTIVQDNYNVSPKKKLNNTIIPFFKKHRADKNTLLINFLSCNDVKHSPKMGANRINDTVCNLTLEKGAYGIVIFDYVKIKHCKKIIDLNF